MFNETIQNILNNLPKLNSIVSCPKCLLVSKFSYKYYSQTENRDLGFIPDVIIEYMERQCPRCNHKWFESCADFKSENKESLPDTIDAVKGVVEAIDKIESGESTNSQGGISGGSSSPTYPALFSQEHLTKSKELFKQIKEDIKDPKNWHSEQCIGEGVEASSIIVKGRNSETVESTKPSDLTFEQKDSKAYIGIENERIEVEGLTKEQLEERIKIAQERNKRGVSLRITDVKANCATIKTTPKNLLKRNADLAQAQYENEHQQKWQQVEETEKTQNGFDKHEKKYVTSGVKLHPEVIEFANVVNEESTESLQQAKAEFFSDMLFSGLKRKAQPKGVDNEDSD